MLYLLIIITCVPIIFYTLEIFTEKFPEEYNEQRKPLKPTTLKPPSPKKNTNEYD